MLDISEPLFETSLEEAASVELPRRKEVWRHLKRSKVGIAGCIITGGFILTAIFGPMLPFIPNPSQQDLEARLTPPVLWGGTWEHVLGTDQLGRDLLARIIEGARVSLLVGLSAVALSAIIGVTLGLIAGYKSGLLDTVITSVADIQIAFPGVLAGLILVTAFGPGVGLVIIVIAMSGWMVFTRVTRGFVFSLKTSLFVEAGELTGAKSARDHARSPAAEPLLLAGDARRARVRRRRPLGVGVLVPRLRCAAARDIVGPDHRPGPRLHHERVVDRHVRGLCDRPRRARHQPDRAVAAVVRRRARP